MRIKYLQQMHDANVDDVKEVTDFEANILIKTGVAKKFGKQSGPDGTLEDLEQKGSEEALPHQPEEQSNQPVDEQSEDIKEQ